MPAYAFFVGGATVIILAVIILARLTQREMVPDPRGGAVIANRRLSVGDLYVNVLLSQVVVLIALVGLAWLTTVPRSAFGIGGHDLSIASQVTIGMLLGLGLYVLNAGSVFVLDRLGIGYSDDLRGALAPNGIVGWVVLLLLVLPVIAISEEVIFRAAMIGAVAAGFGVSPLILVIVSSVAFAVGHGIQGAGGILVTGVLGAVLGAAFVLSGSLLLVVAAHYIVNVLEFVVHEGIGIKSGRPT